MSASATDPFFTALLAELRTDEGCKLKAYLDTRGVWTIGYGQTGPDIHQGVVWAQAHADAALPIGAMSRGLSLEAHAPWISKLDDVRRRVLWNMAYQMGVANVLDFHHALAAIQAGDYVAGARMMLESDWARAQTPARAKRLADHMASGT